MCVCIEKLFLFVHHLPTPVHKMLPKFLLNVSNKLIGQKCTNDLFLSHQIYPLTTSNPHCTQLLLRKILSLGIICGSALVKLPQLFKILLNQSVTGLSLIGHVLELVAATVAFIYNFWFMGRRFFWAGRMPCWFCWLGFMGGRRCNCYFLQQFIQ